MRNKSNTILILSIILIGVAFYFLGSRGIEIKKKNEEKKIEQFSERKNLSPLSGIACENYNRRPFAVILAGDEVVRPLSGLGAADLVIEMPVLEGEINRLMAVYICGNPSEIGSIRSARHDFIPLAMGLDAIFAHWGGSSFAMDKLKTGIIDNLDALTNPAQAFWRKSAIKPPHNGFTSIENLINAAKKLGYRLESNLEGYPHKEFSVFSQQAPAALEINYPSIAKVRWDYQPATNSYLRWRGGKAETDRLDNKQIEARNIVVIMASSRPLGAQYNEVDIEGEGDAFFYFDGKVLKGKWSKAGSYEPSKLYFYDEAGKEIEFQPGQIWIEIIESEKDIVYHIK